MCNILRTCHVCCTLARDSLSIEKGLGPVLYRATLSVFRLSYRIQTLIGFNTGQGTGLCKRKAVSYKDTAPRNALEILAVPALPFNEIDSR